jgi:hypothetical protein
MEGIVEMGLLPLLSGSKEELLAVRFRFVCEPG